MSDNPVINVSAVNYRYGGTTNQYQAAEEVPALTDINLQIPAGQCVLLCGPSGGGKSSLLRLMNGLIPHFHEGVLEGSVHVNGCETKSAKLNELGLSTSTVFQNPRTQFFTGQVDSELAFTLENACTDPQVIRRQVAAATQKLKITDLLNRPLTQMSGGQLQKVACAGALTTGAKILLFDEPTANLDRGSIQSWRQVLQELREQGFTMVFAEHRLYYLQGIIDRALVVADGQIKADMTAPEFWGLSDSKRESYGLRTLSDQKIPAELNRTESHNGRGRQPAPESLGKNDGSETDSPESLGENGVELEAIKFAYGKKTILDIDRMRLPAGKVNVIVGENGAGKTTLLRLLCGLEKPARGTIKVDGKNASKRSLNKQAFLVAQDVNRQLFSASVGQEVCLGIPKAEQPSPEDLTKLLADFDLDKLTGRHPLSLSGGQKQRLVVAAARAAKTRIYLFDEPSSGVDRRHLETMARTLRELADSGAVVVVVTHDYELLGAAADRVIELQAICPEERHEA